MPPPTPPSSGRRKPSPPPKIPREVVFFYSIVVFMVVVWFVEVSLFNGISIYQMERQMLDLATNFVALGSHHHLKGLPLSKATADDDEYGDPGTESTLPTHLLPHPPILPLFDSIPDAETHIRNVLDGNPTMIGVVALLQRFLSKVHESNQRAREADGETVLNGFFRTTHDHLQPFEEAYRGKSIFPVREDDSVFISLAAFREWYLVETLVSAFKNARNPDKLFVGAVIQNCFGTIREDGSLDTSGTPCKAGKKKVGVNDKGKDILKEEKLGVDKNGIAAFCALPDYQKYCENGQVRVVYQHHTDGQGPSMARYYASKLWGGETFFFQIDSHLRFAHHWDAKLIEDARLTSNYPKSILSTYPPGFDQLKFVSKKIKATLGKIENDTVVETPSTRLCHCGTPKGVNPMLHMAGRSQYHGNETRPTQIPWLGAGLVFAHGSLLRDVPFDPYLPYTFMGEEALLAMRAWTHGWNLHAPRKNLVTHMYRTGNTGLPKFYGSITSMFKGFGYGFLQRRMIRRIKCLIGYPLQSPEKLRDEGLDQLLTDIDHYGMGNTRSWEEFMEFAQVRVNATNGDLVCTKRLDWCADGLKV